MAEPAADVPEISVILPLMRGRGQARKCIQGWLCDQTFDRRNYELVLVGNGEDPQLEAWARARLGPRDRLLSHPTEIELELSHRGGEHAKGRYLVFSELHCVPANDCLAELHSFLCETGCDVARCRSVDGDIDGPLIQRFESLKFGHDFQVRLASTVGLKVLMHGFAIKREAYFEAGGLEYRYGSFAEWAMEAKLADLGKKMGYCESATVYHRYGATLAAVRAYVEDFCRGELNYRADHDTAYCNEHFGTPPSPDRDTGATRVEGRSLVRALGRSLWRDVRTGDGTRVGSAGRRILQLLPTAAFGVPERLLRARVAQQTALLRIWLWRFDLDKCYRAYVEYWAAQVCIFQLENGTHRQGREWPRALEYDLATLSPDRLVGFHDVERLEGKAFRWSEPAALIKVAVPRDDYEIELSLLDLRPWTTPARLQAYIGGRGLECTSFDYGRGMARFRAPRRVWDREDNLYDLVLISSEYRPRDYGAPDDRRSLGIALRSLRFTPLLPD